MIMSISLLLQTSPSTALILFLVQLMLEMLLVLVFILLRRSEEAGR
jgi:hypothetical protein